MSHNKEWSKQKLERKLNHAGIARRCDAAEVSAGREARVRVRQVHRVEQIEELRAQLQTHPLTQRQRKTPEHRQVGGGRSGTEQRVAALIAIGPDRRQRESRTVEKLPDAVSARTVSRQHRVPNPVGPLVPRAPQTPAGTSPTA